MSFKILFVISLITICSGVSNYQKPQNNSDRATYSHSFVREDIPLSYNYSAVHQYTPIKFVDSDDPETESDNSKNVHPNSFYQKDIQYAPIPISRNHTYPPQSMRYTSVTATPNPVPEYENYEKPGYPPVKKDHLEPKPVPVYVKHMVVPTTNKKPNKKEYDYKYFQNIPADYYPAPINQIVATTETPKKELNELLKHFDIYQQFQQPRQQANFVRHAHMLANSSKNDNILLKQYSFLPKQEPVNKKPLHTKKPFNSKRVFSIQLPRIAYQNNFKSKPEKLGFKVPKYPSHRNYARFPK